MTEQQLLAKTWFYRFPLPSGAVTPVYDDGALDEVHTTRAQMMARALREHFGAQAILSAIDLACHQGWFSWQLTEHGVAQVTGIEPRAEHVADARAVMAVMGLSERIRIEQCDVHDSTPERFGTHPLVLCFGLIYHLENPIGALRRAFALTAPGGLCLVETQVVPGMRGLVDWGNYRFVRALQGSFGIIDETEETHGGEASTLGICLAPDTEGLLWIMRKIGFREVALVPPPADGYEQHLYGKRVMVRGVAPGQTHFAEYAAAARFRQVANQNQLKSEQFLAENRTKKNVLTLASGIQYRVLEEGNGARPTAKSEVSVHYRGSLISGLEFDSSFTREQPATFQVEQLLPGWQEILPLMQVGDTWQVFLPAEKAYGERAPQAIGPNQALQFEIKLLAVK